MTDVSLRKKPAFKQEPEQVRWRWSSPVAFKTKLMECIREQYFVSAEPNISVAEAEHGFIKYLTKRAFDPMDPDAGTILKELLTRAYPPLKPTQQTIHFSFAPGSTPTEQVSQILEATSRGEIPPDIATSLAATIKSAVDIEAMTDIKERLQRLEALLAQNAEED